MKKQDNKTSPPVKVVGFRVEGVSPSPQETSLADAAGGASTAAGSPSPVIIPPNFAVRPPPPRCPAAASCSLCVANASQPMYWSVPSLITRPACACICCLPWACRGRGTPAGAAAAATPHLRCAAPRQAPPAASPLARSTWMKIREAVRACPPSGLRQQRRGWTLTRLPRVRRGAAIGLPSWPAVAGGCRCWRITGHGVHVMACQSGK
jgi:hypothetical protein